MSRLVKQLMFISMLMVVVAMIAAYRLYNKPHRSVAEASFQLATPAELIDAFTIDEAAANEKYLDQVVEVHGIVERIDVNQAGETILVFGSDDPMSTVRCTMSPGEPMVGKGSAIAVRGICTGYLTDVVVTRAIVIQ